MKKTGRGKTRPRLFIGSSAEAIDIVGELGYLLDRDAWVTPWNLMFEVSDVTLPKLCQGVGKFDFGVFLFVPDDIVRIRKRRYSAVRDNVLFELGLFIGELGPNRTFIVMPRGISGFRLPTDLLGITPATYEKRPDRDLRLALHAPAQEIRRVMRRLGPIRRKQRGSKRDHQQTVTALIGEGVPVPEVETPKTKSPPTEWLKIPPKKILVMPWRPVSLTNFESSADDVDISSIDGYTQEPVTEDTMKTPGQVISVDPLDATLTNEDGTES